MINITNNAVVNKIKGTGRTFTLSIKVGTNTFTKVKSLRRSSIFASNQKLSVGEAVSAFIEAEINDCRESLQNYEVEPILSIEGYNIPLGIFKVQAPSQADGSGTQKITAYDRMSETSKFTYKATGLTSAISTFQAICTTCGYTADTSGLTDVSINDRLLDGLDCRKALGYVAGVFGKNCVVTTDGKFKMLGYSKIAESTCKISINSLDTLEFPSKVSTIDYFNAVVDEATIFKSGTGNNGVNVVNPLFKGTTQTYNILTYLKSNVGSNGYYPAKFKQLNGDPRIELGDVIKVEHRNIVTGEVGADYVPVMSLVLDYDGGVAVSIEAYPTESEFSMSLSDKMDLTNSSNNNRFEDLAGDIDNVNGRVDGFEEDIEGANQKADFATVRAEAVEELNKVISSSLGLYQTQKEGVGGDVKYYFHNKPTLEESTYIISMTDQGFAFTNSWSENESEIVWTYGINPAGNSIMNYLVANKISADLIEAGVIKSLDGAPVKSDFSLNTGKFTLESNSKNESFGFGANRYNHLLLQYNYSDSGKKSVKLGYYYGGRFYEDSAYTELIEASEDYYYGDISTGYFYKYSSDTYSQLTDSSDLSDVYKTYKGFIMHSQGISVGYEYNSLLGLFSDFTVNMSNVLGGNFGIVNELPDGLIRTPVFKFYDFEDESANGSDHYTAIRKQSIVTKYLGAENICFYLDEAKAVDLGMVIRDLQNADVSSNGKITSLENNLSSLSSSYNNLLTYYQNLNSFVTSLSELVSGLSTKVDSLETDVARLKEALGVKSLVVFVSASPSEAGNITNGSGSYVLEDGTCWVVAQRSADNYYIASVDLVYRSDGDTTTYSREQLISDSRLNEETEQLQLPIAITAPRLGDNLDVTVNFESKLKLTLLVDPEGVDAGYVTSDSGYYFWKNETTKITATPHTSAGYEFVGWYENGSLLYSSPNATIVMSSDRTLTAKFEKVETEAKSMTVKLTNGSNSASEGDRFYFSSDIEGADYLGTEITFAEGDSHAWVIAKPGTDRKIVEIEAYADGELVDSQTLDQTSMWKGIVEYTEIYAGKTIEYKAYFDDVDTSGDGVLVDGDTITEGVEVFVEIPAQRQMVYLEFVPQYSGSYTFESIGGDNLDYSVVDPDGFVYNEDKLNHIASDVSSGGFSVTYDSFVAGTTYYLGTRLYGGAGNLKVKVSYNGSSSGGGSGDSTVAKIKISSSGKADNDRVLLLDDNMSTDYGTERDLAVGEKYVVAGVADANRATTKVEVYTDGTLTQTYSPTSHAGYWVSAGYFVNDFTVDSSMLGKTTEYKVYFGEA